VYLVFKENIQIDTLLKRGNKNVDIKFSAHERFWNNLHQVAQNQKIGKPNNLIALNLKQYVMKEAVIYKILRYRQNRCHTNEERWTEHSGHKAKIQHPQQCQSVFTVESQDNIPD
jgi:hypothetical protein